jgi:hypothetical protein
MSAAATTLTPGRAGAIGAAARYLLQDRSVPLPHTAAAVLARAATLESSPPLALLVASLRADTASMLRLAPVVSDALAAVDHAEGAAAIAAAAAHALDAIGAFAVACNAHALTMRTAQHHAHHIADGAAVALHAPTEEIRRCPGAAERVYPCGAPLAPGANLCAGCVVEEQHPDLNAPDL